jgi:poly-gamma-glutamate capsule biosynthesis protein CapA/YwtB (metallophosphatase superfamily)
MKLLTKEGKIKKGGISDTSTSSLKIVFLGDIRVSRSGKPPKLDADLKKLLKNADVIVANVESPVVNSKKNTKRGLSLNFEMDSSFLTSIHACNRKAKWVFSIANNHACDTSRKNGEDVSGVKTTIDNIRSAIPNAEIIGAEIGEAKSVLSLQVESGPKIGLVGWTEVMNHDKQHYKKKIIRETDLTSAKIAKIKDKHDMLIGFAHGNEEQSYYPLKETRDRWCNLISERKFDVIVGHGPHVLQPAEQVGKQGLLFHSIGNFCSPLGKSQTKIGCIPELAIHHDKDGQISSTDYKTHILQQKKREHNNHQRH